MIDLAHRSATELCRVLREGEVSSRELLEIYLSRVAGPGAALRAVVTLDADAARQRADEADAARARGESWGPLHGLPITVKDCFETARTRTTCGATALADHVPERDAVGVARLRDAGAIVFGKTNTPAWASDWQTTNELFGTTGNPWDPARTPGGSSGGSAAAVAAGLSGLELGSDIGGSIRIPAHCCGVFGHKPTWGIVPQRGHIPGLPGSLVEKDINVVGPLARSAEDLALALGLLAGPLPEVARGWRLELPAPRTASLREMRVGAWLEEPGFPIALEVSERLESAVTALERAGVAVDRRARPELDLRAAVSLYRRLLAPLMADTLPDDAYQALLDLAKGGPGAVPAELADFANALGLRQRDWLALDDERQRERAAWQRLFADVDVMLLPVLPVPAIPHDHSEPMILREIRVGGEMRPYTDFFTWMGPIGSTGLPASVAPVGRTPAGLPVGIQIVAGPLEDRTAIHFAGLLADLHGGYEPPPDAPDGARGPDLEP